MAAIIDGLIVLLADGVCTAVFYGIAGVWPPRQQIIALSTALLGVLWATYQYLLIVYAGTTPGLLTLRLEIQHFDGSFADRRRRRWRVLGSILSGASLAMGYAWRFLDEDGLLWHERITKTYVAAGKNSPGQN